MRTTLAALGLVAGLGAIACQSAVALPIDAAAVQQAATATTSLQQAQYRERRRRGTITKCYREFVVGNYVCRTHRAW
jgi:hypothetical protein